MNGDWTKKHETKIHSGRRPHIFYMAVLDCDENFPRQFSANPVNTPSVLVEWTMLNDGVDHFQLRRYGQLKFKCVALMPSSDFRRSSLKILPQFNSVKRALSITSPYHVTQSLISDHSSTSTYISSLEILIRRRGFRRNGYFVKDFLGIRRSLYEYVIDNDGLRLDSYLPKYRP